MLHLSNQGIESLGYETAQNIDHLYGGVRACVHALFPLAAKVFESFTPQFRLALIGKVLVSAALPVSFVLVCCLIVSCIKVML